MKRFIPYSLIAAALACGLASAQTTAYTTPVGYTTNTLVKGFNPVGLTVHQSVLVAGLLTNVAGLVLTDTNVPDFATVLPVNRTYIIEITNGTGKGATQEFTTVSGSTMTMPASIGAAIGSAYQVRVAPTLEELFGTTTSILKKSNSAGLADHIYIPDGNGSYIQYFLNNAATPAYRRITSPAAAAPNTPVVYLDGIFIERQDTGTVDFVNSGEVKKVLTISSIMKGFNLVGINYPAGVTLQNCGLDAVVKKNNTAGLADHVYVWDSGISNYVQYFLNNASTPAWRRITAPAGPAPADLALSSAVFIERQDAGTVPVTYTPPSYYSSL